MLMGASYELLLVMSPPDKIKNTVKITTIRNEGENRTVQIENR